MFWIICAALAGVVPWPSPAPLLRRQARREPAAAYDLAIYRDQLREVERDLERGVIDAADASGLRVEIGRKVLAADGAPGNRPAAPGARRGWAALALLAALLGGAFLTYQGLGQPDSTDAPIALDRPGAGALRQPPQRDRCRGAGPQDPDAPSPCRICRPDPSAAEAVQKNPNDPRGLELLAEHEERLGNLVAAKDAQHRLVAARGESQRRGSGAAGRGLTIVAAGGIISRDGEEAVAQALARVARNPQARFMAGLLHLQNGRPDQAFPVWARLLAEGPENAPWIAPIRGSIQDSGLVCRPPGLYPARTEPLVWTPGMPSLPAMPGPDADDGRAEEMTAEERQEMVEGMVKGLETRLATQDGTAEEWARLISSLPVIGQKDHAADILAEARRQFAGNGRRWRSSEAAAKQASLE
uniref:CycH protein n=1 Tax=Paracoccus denitrificans TaxID=266 RepID=Q51691_PARDE|nr:cycH [Paracoccus denitrificans]